MNVKLVKNKVAPPFKKTSVNLHTGVDGIYGFDIFQEVLDFAIKEGYITKAGSWFSYGDEKIGQGEKKAGKWLEEHPDLYEEFKKKIIDKIQNQNKCVEGSMNDELQKQAQEKEEKKERKRKAKEEKEEVPEFQDQYETIVNAGFVGSYEDYIEYKNSFKEEEVSDKSIKGPGTTEFREG